MNRIKDVCAKYMMLLFMRIWYNLLLFLFVLQIEKKAPEFLNNDVSAIFISDSRHHTLFSKKMERKLSKEGWNPKIRQNCQDGKLIVPSWWEIFISLSSEKK